MGVSAADSENLPQNFETDWKSEIAEDRCKNDSYLFCT